MKTINDLQAGKVGEYLVCADLILKGFIAYPSEQGLAYDVVCDTGKKLLKIQVKTTRQPMPVPQRKVRTKKYIFNVSRCGKGGKKSYQKGDVDIFALVALDTKEIGYILMEDIKQTMFFLPMGVKPINDATEKKEKIKELKKAGKSYTEISKELGVDRGYANRVVLGRENGGFSSSYLSDYKIEEII